MATSYGFTAVFHPVPDHATLGKCFEISPLAAADIDDAVDITMSQGGIDKRMSRRFEPPLLTVVILAIIKKLWARRWAARRSNKFCNMAEPVTTVRRPVGMW